MPTLTLTEIVGEPREWAPKDNPTRKFHSWIVKDDKGQPYEINTKVGNEVKLGADEFDVTPPKPGTSFPAKLKRVQQGGAGGGRGRSPAETARIERMAAHKTAAAILGPCPLGSESDLQNYMPTFKWVTDWLVADLPASVPATSAVSPIAQRSQASTGVGSDEGRDTAASGFSSEKQEAHFRRLLKAAGGSDATVGFVTWYAKENLSPSLISEALDGLADESTRQATAKSLAVDANAWSIETGNTQPDVADLPEVAA